MSHRASRYGVVVGLALVGLLPACTQGGSPLDQLESEMSSSLITDGVAHAVLRDANNVVVANVRFGTHTVGSRIQVTGVGLTTGIHGFHVHANNDPSNGDGCVGPTFASADGHYNPSGAVHPNHAGDMPVLFFSTAQAAFAGSPTFGYNDFISSNFTPNEVKGKAIIIHALPDNCANIPTRYTPQPPDATTLGTGDAGGRVACGVITD